MVKYKTQGVRKLVRCLSGNIGQTFLMSKLSGWLILCQKDAVIYAETTSAIIIASQRRCDFYAPRKESLD